MHSLVRPHVNGWTYSKTCSSINTRSRSVQIAGNEFNESAEGDIDVLGALEATEELTMGGMLGVGRLGSWRYLLIADVGEEVGENGVGRGALGSVSAMGDAPSRASKSTVDGARGSVEEGPCSGENEARLSFPCFWLDENPHCPFRVSKLLELDPNDPNPLFGKLSTLVLEYGPGEGREKKVTASWTGTDVEEISTRPDFSEERKSNVALPYLADKRGFTSGI